MRKPQSFPIRSVSLGLVLLGGASARAEMLTFQDLLRDPSVANALEECAPSEPSGSLVELSQSASWRHRIGDLAASAPSELESKEFHPAPEPSGLLLGLIAAIGTGRLIRARR